jgi:hypothetical protein
MMHRSGAARRAITDRGLHEARMARAWPEDGASRAIGRASTKRMERDVQVTDNTRGECGTLAGGPAEVPMIRRERSLRSWRHRLPNNSLA